MLKTLAFIGVLILVVTSSAGAQSKATDPNLQAAIEARQKAVDTRNGAEWSKFTADDFVRINVDGSIVGRSQQLKAMSANTAKPTPMAIDRIQMFGPDAADDAARSKYKLWWHPHHRVLGASKRHMASRDVSVHRSHGEVTMLHLQSAGYVRGSADPNTRQTCRSASVG